MTAVCPATDSPDGWQAVEQSAETDRGQCDRHWIEGNPLRGCDVFELMGSQPARNQSKRQDEDQQPTPGQINNTSPDAAGPRAGAIAGTAVTIAMIRPRRDSGTKRIIVVMSSGTNTAVPAAWMMGPVSRKPKPGQAASIAVPIIKSDRALRKIVRRWKRCITNPVAGINTARVRR